MARKNEEYRMLDELADMEERLSDWERSFIESLAEQLGHINPNRLSDRQLDKLKQIYEKRVLGY